MIMKIQDILPMALLIPGLIMSAFCRRMKWGAAVWMVTLLCFGYAIHDVASQPVGWFWQIIELPCLVVLVLGCCACVWLGPRGPGLRVANFAAALAMTAVAAAAYEWRMSETLGILITDASGRPIPQVRAEFTMNWNTTIKRRGEALSDEAGRISLQSRRGWSSHVYLTPMADYSRDPDLKPQSLGLGIKRSIRQPGMCEVYRGWRTAVGDATINGSYTAMVPYAKRLALPVTLCPGGQIVSPLRRDQIRAEFDRITSHPENGLSYLDVCSNLEAVDFIPDLIALWTEGRTNRHSLVPAMGRLAEILNDADRGCAQLQPSLDRPVDIHGRSSKSRIRADIASLSEWAGIPDDGTSPDLRRIEVVRDYIRSRARTLLEFALRYAETDPGARIVLGNLGTLARPELPGLVARLLQHPPPDIRTALDWGRVFFRLNATRSEVADLIGSGNPMLQKAAEDARPDHR